MPKPHDRPVKNPGTNTRAAKSKRAAKEKERIETAQTRFAIVQFALDQIAMHPHVSG